jgi:LDH2 family malate/lactate/ureidoglycolate dehydrogenase
MLVESSLRGIDSHGVVAHLASYAKDALNGTVDVSAQPEVVGVAGATAVIDGRHGPGLRTASLALEKAMELSDSYGVGVAVARNVGYLAGMWWSVEPALAREKVALVAMNSEACVAPHGGKAAFHGTNPIALAVPNGERPIMLDMRTNGLRMADFYASQASGAPLPAGGLIDKDGVESTDPAALFEGGTTLPLAGAYGWGLSLLVDVLAPVLAGGPITDEVPALSGGVPAAYSCFFLALEPSFFLPREQFQALVAQLVDEAAAAPPTDPATPVRVPGDRARAERSRRLSEGIPVDPTLWSRFETKLAELGLSDRLLEVA